MESSALSKVSGLNVPRSIAPPSRRLSGGHPARCAQGRGRPKQTRAVSRESRREAGATFSLALPLFALPHYDGGVSFSETIFLFVLALIVFGPKKLPEIARQAGKLLAELRRASNEFRSQIDAEIAHLEVQKTIQKDQSLVPPTQAPAAAVASLSQNPSPPITHQLEAATLASPTVEASAPSARLNPASDITSIANPAEPLAAASPAAAQTASAVAAPANELTPTSASQDSHV